MLKDEDRIFKNLYNDLGWEIDSAIKRGEWNETKNIISKGKDTIINEIKDIAKVESKPKFEGRQMVMIIQPL